MVDVGLGYINRTRVISRGHKHKLVVQHSRVDARQHFFCNRVVSVWNSLPEYVILLPTVGLFRIRLSRVNLDRFLFVKCYRCIARLEPWNMGMALSEL